MVDVGEPPLRGAVLASGAGGFGDLAYHCYLESVDCQLVLEVGAQSKRQRRRHAWCSDTAEATIVR